MRWWGRVVSARARAVLLLGVLIVAGMAAYGFGVFGHLSSGGFSDPHTESSHELRLEQSTFGNRSADVLAIYSSDSVPVTDPQFRADVQSVLDRLHVPQIVRVTTWYQTHAPTMISKDGHTTAVVVTLAGNNDDDFTANYKVIKPLFTADGLRLQLGGQYAVFDDVNHTVSHDIERAETLSMPIVLILSLLIFGSLVSALMPVMVGAVAVVGAFCAVRLINTVADVSVFAINVITLLGMGLAIDYALFIVSRFREELSKRGDSKEDVAAAVTATMSTAGRTVLVSGVTVAAALASLLIFPQVFLRSMGYGGMAAVLVAMLAALTILPAVLTVLGRRINAVPMPWSGRIRTSATDHGWWARLAHAVMRRPIAYLVSIVIVVLALASPLLGVKWGSVDYRVLPKDAPSRVAQQHVIDQMGGELSTANVLLHGADASAAAQYTQRIRAVPGVATVQVLASKPNDTLLQASWRGNTQTQRSQDIVKQLRAVPTPRNAQALVGGTSAQTVDLIGSVGRHLPWMALFVAVVMLVLLFVAFGSFVLPIKAVLMNTLSIGASFGVVTWIFADGHLQSLLSFTSGGYLDATQPILMLAVLFGLSMDYEVFLLSRIREQWDATGDNTTAVAAGVQRTGRIITSAALLLAVVIGAFSTSSIVFMKMIGVGMLVAVLLDATVVRMLLVPATMRLLGRLNWWAPGPFRRWYERYGLHEQDQREEPELARST